MNKMEMFMTIICLLILLIMVLLSVAFFTLLERKVLSYIQLRKGPNKVGLIGIVQPFNDAIKLFSKEYLLIYLSNYIFFLLSPLLNILVSLFIWILLPYLELLLNFNYSLLFMFSCMSVVIYFIMLMAWSSNSSYSMLGGLRSMAQVISYEVSLMLIILSVIFLMLSFNFLNLILYQKFIWFIWLIFPLFICLFVSFLAETNRSPFDFAEGESELVSGFNIEYGSGSFAIIFLAEYISILFFCFFLSFMFLGGVNSYFYVIKVVFLVFMVIWVRGIMPRYRYDKLMYLSWKIYLPISLNYLILLLGGVFFMFL
uniref:NADH-ubiquinone oxidoreductase chain 1 n=1 Tax=Ceraclea indistincta TaxID=2904887 RepID=A0A9E8LNR3_9NEOP|nr:NADH dehydrogenase subunit 1 [Ceraclea indistincta]UZZ43830.1 NADH dehydrogenase subunit 1 [Ceraclea indistincta]